MSVDTFSCSSLGGLLIGGCGIQWWDPTARRVDHQRGLIGLAELVAGVEPKLIVVTDTVGRLYVVAHGKCREAVSLVLCGFFGGEKGLIGQILWPLEGCQRPKIPHAIEVRCTPGSARWVAGCGAAVLGQCCHGRQNQRQ